MDTVTITAPRTIRKGDKVYVQARGDFYGIPGIVVRKAGRYQTVIRLAYPPSDKYLSADGTFDPIYYFENTSLLTEADWNALRLACVDPNRVVTLVESKVDTDPVWGSMETETAYFAASATTVIRQQTGDVLHAVIVNNLPAMDALIAALQEARAVMADPATYLPADI